VLLLPFVACINAQVQPLNITVAQDGSGHFRTVQAAIDSTRNNSADPYYIYIKRGTYREKVLVPATKRNLHFYGESRTGSVISWDDYNGKPPDFTTGTSYTMQIRGTDCSLRDMTVENTAGTSVEQAVALDLIGDRITIRNCNIMANQDTLYARGDGARHYVFNSIIEGTTDFIFGSATAIFERCTLRSLKDSYITAASTLEGQPFGYVFRNCTLVRGLTGVNSVYLGRPWRPYAQTVFLTSEMESHILPAGWHNWNDPANERTAFYAEYGTTGVDVSQRVPWSRQLTAAQAAQYTTSNVFNGWTPPQ